MADVEIRENGTSVTVNKGDRIIIRISENPTTGYQWTPDTIPDHLELESTGVTPPEPLQAGAAGERLIRLRASRPGHGVAEFTLTRPWESQSLDRWRAGVTVT